MFTCLFFQLPVLPGQVLEMFTYLGIGSLEDPYVKEVAQMAISAPMPEGWQEVENNKGNVVFA